MNADELNATYGAMISPDAVVSVPEEWMPVVHTAMKAFVDLPSEVRAFIIVIAIDQDVEGEIRFSVAGAVEFLTSQGLGLVRQITDNAVAATRQITGVQH